jgi:small subunit ribosomal protein S20
MPITQSAKKALRGSKRKKIVNDRRTKAMKDAIKKIEKLAKAGKKDDAKKVLGEAYQAIDKAAKINVINKNNAARKKSRLAKLIK